MGDDVYISCCRRRLDIVVSSSIVDVVDVFVPIVGVEVGLPVARITAPPHKEGDYECEDEKSSHDCTRDHHYLGHVHPAYQIVVLQLAQRHAFELGWAKTSVKVGIYHLKGEIDLESKIAREIRTGCCSSTV